MTAPIDAVAPGPCWAAPSARQLGSNTIPVRCELLAGHAGAHQCDRGHLGGTWTWPEDEQADDRAIGEELRFVPDTLATYAGDRAGPLTHPIVELGSVLRAQLGNPERIRIRIEAAE